MNVSAICINTTKLSTISSNQKAKNKSNLVNDDVSFEAKRFPSGVFEDYDIEVAQKYVKRVGNEWKNELLQELNKSDRDLAENLGNRGTSAPEYPGILKVFPLTALYIGIKQLARDFKTIQHLPANYREINKAWVYRIGKLVEDLRAGHKGTDVGQV